MLSKPAGSTIRTTRDQPPGSTTSACPSAPRMAAYENLHQKVLSEGAFDGGRTVNSALLGWTAGLGAHTVLQRPPRREQPVWRHRPRATLATAARSPTACASPAASARPSARPPSTSLYYPASATPTQARKRLQQGDRPAVVAGRQLRHPHGVPQPISDMIVTFPPIPAPAARCRPACGRRWCGRNRWQRYAPGQVRPGSRHRLPRRQGPRLRRQPAAPGQTEQPLPRQPQRRARHRRVELQAWGRLRRGQLRQQLPRHRHRARPAGRLRPPQRLREVRRHARLERRRPGQQPARQAVRDRLRLQHPAPTSSSAYATPRGNS